MITVQKARLSGSLGDLQRKVEDLVRDQGPHEYLAGTRLRELAVALAMQADLNVSVVTYADESQELEVVLTDHPSCDPIVIGRDHLGGRCQLTWERWLPIEDQPGIETVVNRVFELDRARYTDALRCVTVREKAQWPLEDKDGQLVVINQLHSAACRCAGYAGAGPKILICDDRE